MSSQDILPETKRKAGHGPALGKRLWQVFLAGPYQFIAIIFAILLLLFFVIYLSARAFLGIDRIDNHIMKFHEKHSVSEDTIFAFNHDFYFPDFSNYRNFLREQKVNISFYEFFSYGLTDSKDREGGAESAATSNIVDLYLSKPLQKFFYFSASEGAKARLHYSLECFPQKNSGRNYVDFSLWINDQTVKMDRSDKNTSETIEISDYLSKIIDPYIGKTETSNSRESRSIFKHRIEISLFPHSGDEDGDNMIAAMNDGIDYCSLNMLVMVRSEVLYYKPGGWFHSAFDGIYDLFVSSK